MPIVSFPIYPLHLYAYKLFSMSTVYRIIVRSNPGFLSDPAGHYARVTFVRQLSRSVELRYRLSIIWPPLDDRISNGGNRLRRANRITSLISVDLVYGLLIHIRIRVESRRDVGSITPPTLEQQNDLSAPNCAAPGGGNEALIR